MKILVRPVGAELMHSSKRTKEGRKDRQDMKKLKVALPNFGNAPKNEVWDIIMTLTF
jgi:hypothetical protein